MDNGSKLTSRHFPAWESINELNWSTFNQESRSKMRMWKFPWPAERRVSEDTVVSKPVACTAPDSCLTRRVQPAETAQQS
jgi:hypothetical protein